ncbi:hypothetical protein NK718_15435 [Alsobacter sp. SYSU M60028]|uniref:Restriction endonuclease type II EcoRII N-terminal domain-containing protein n=1 Tax=Alsobacter ponti TaxID=2962936 RepID=A0ABT1LI58_9HYPH|nr:EcoRII N-terminal effector-binding domain-containing protein [Alsobacter ponti]MCP8939918.1 hypothetical protein [Alsobacter ponti]
MGESLAISKTLSANDAGDTGAHQAGILVPKEEKILSFFPHLAADRRNPRAHLLFRDESGAEWEFAFIYYNNRLFGGTRNEYRLTRMTRYIREQALVPGDEVLLSRDGHGSYSITARRLKKSTARRDAEGRVVLQLGGGWRIIELHGGGK